MTRRAECVSPRYNNAACVFRPRPHPTDVYGARCPWAICSEPKYLPPTWCSTYNIKLPAYPTSAELYSLDVRNHKNTIRHPPPPKSQVLLGTIRLGWGLAIRCMLTSQRVGQYSSLRTSPTDEEQAAPTYEVSVDSANTLPYFSALFALKSMGRASEAEIRGWVVWCRRQVGRCRSSCRPGGWGSGTRDQCVCENQFCRFQSELVWDLEGQDTCSRCANWLRGRHPDTSGVVGGERGGDSCLLFKCL